MDTLSLSRTNDHILNGSARFQDENSITLSSLTLALAVATYRCDLGTIKLELRI